MDNEEPVSSMGPGCFGCEARMSNSKAPAAARRQRNESLLQISYDGKMMRPAIACRTDQLLIISFGIETFEFPAINGSIQNKPCFDR